MSSTATPSNDSRLKADQPRENGSTPSRPGRGGRGRGRGGRGRGRGRGGSPTTTSPDGPQANASRSLIDRLGPPPHLVTDISTSPAAAPFPRGPDSPTPSATSSRNRRHRKSSAASTLSVSVSGANTRSRNKDNSPQTPLSSVAKELVTPDAPVPILSVPSPTDHVVVANVAAHLLAAPELRAASPLPQPASRPYTPVGIDWAGDDDDDGSLPDLNDWGLSVKSVPSSGSADPINTDNLQLGLQQMSLTEVPEDATPKPRLEGESSTVQGTKPNGPPSTDASVKVTAASQGSPPSQANGANPVPSLPPKPTLATIEQSYAASLKSFDPKNRNAQTRSDVASVPLPDPRPQATEGASTPSLSLLPPTPPAGHRTSRTRSARGHSRNSSSQGNSKLSNSLTGNIDNESDQPPGIASSPGPNTLVPTSAEITIRGTARSTSNQSPSNLQQKSTGSSVSNSILESVNPTTPLPNGSPSSERNREPTGADEPRSPSPVSGRGGSRRGGHDGNPFGNFHSPGRGGHHGHPRGGFHGHGNSSHGNQRSGGRGGLRARTHSNASSTAGSSSTTPGNEGRRGPSSGSNEGPREGTAHGHSRSLSRPIISQSALSRLNSTLTQSPPKRGGPASSSPTRDSNTPAPKNHPASGTLQAGVE